MQDKRKPIDQDDEVIREILLKWEIWLESFKLYGLKTINFIFILTNNFLIILINNVSVFKVKSLQFNLFFHSIHTTVSKSNLTNIELQNKYII